MIESRPCSRFSLSWVAVEPFEGSKNKSRSCPRENQGRVFVKIEVVPSSRMHPRSILPWVATEPFQGSENRGRVFVSICPEWQFNPLKVQKIGVVPRSFQPVPGDSWIHKSFLKKTEVVSSCYSVLSGSWTNRSSKKVHRGRILVVIRSTGQLSSPSRSRPWCNLRRSA